MWFVISHLPEYDVVEQKEYLQSLVSCVQHRSSTPAKHPHVGPSVSIDFGHLENPRWGRGNSEEKMKRAFGSIFQASGLKDEKDQGNFGALSFQSEGQM